MSTPDHEVLRREAREAWRTEEARLAGPSSSDARLLALAVAVTSGALALVTLRVARLFLDRPGALALVLLVGAALVLTIVGGPLVIARRRRQAARAARARAPRVSRCPRCSAPIGARGEDEAAARECGACGGALLEAEGLIIAHARDAEWRRRRWRGQARAQLKGAGHAGSAAVGAPPRRAGEWALSPMLWIGGSAVALGIIWTSAAALGGQGLEAPLGLDRQVPLHPLSLEPASSARADTSELGPPTRPRAPLWTGTSVLAAHGAPHYHEPAVIVRVDEPSAFVVYASGESAWVHARELYAPHLAVGDAVEVRDGDAFVRAQLLRRIGSAALVSDESGRERWTSLARLRVRSDARHAPGGADGRSSSEVPADAWVEARVGGSMRPGIVVERAADGASARVVLSDGSARWIARGDLERQRIGPGARLSVEGRGSRIVAARVGDALAVLDARGRRSWTSLARVRR